MVHISPKTLFILLRFVTISQVSTAQYSPVLTSHKASKKLPADQNLPAAPESTTDQGHTMAPPLPDVILEEIFLRLPPDEPACLVRASLASKPWLRELTGARFRARYRDFHGAPPMLGFLYYRSREPNPVQQPHLVSTTGFQPRLPGDGWGGRQYAARDCRHGRVLLEDRRQRPTELAVWDPMTGRRTVQVAPGRFWSHRAAVLCAVDRCDHGACHDGPSRVVLVAMDRGVARAYVSSSPADTGGEWSSPCSALELDTTKIATIEPMPAALVNGALYFLFTYFADDTIRVLKYDLGSACLSTFDAPRTDVLVDDSILLAMQDGSLGLACLNHKLILRLWSRQTDNSHHGVSSSWTTHPRVIDLNGLLPPKDPNKFTIIRPMLVGSVEGGDIVFVTTDMGIYEINLKSLQSKKLWNPEGFVALIPYMGFYSPQERTNLLKSNI